MKLDHNFGIDEEVVFLEVERCQGFPAEELERAVEISDRHPKGKRRESVVPVGDEVTVIGTLKPRSMNQSGIDAAKKEITIVPCELSGSE